MPLVIPAKHDFEREAVARAWHDRGGEVLRLDRFWDLPASLVRSEVTLYGNDTFCLVVAEKLGLDLLAPDDRLLASAPDNLLRRRVEVRHLAELNPSDFPLFVKPAVPKQFRSAVYPSCQALAIECQGLPTSTECLASEVVTFQAEARAFALDGIIRACSVYEGQGSVDHAAKCAERVVMALDLPRSCVVDVGCLGGNTWVLVELNASWGAGLNGCPAPNVLDCIEAATVAS